MLRDLLQEWRKRGIACIVSGAKGQVRISIEDEFVHLKDRLLDQTSLMIDIKDAVLLAKARINAHSSRLTSVDERRIFERQGSGDLLDEKEGKIQRSQSAHPSV